MATQTIQFRSPPSQTVTLRLFVAGSDTQIASAAATEATNRKGTYAADFTDVPAAEYQYIATIGTSPIIPVASGYVLLTLTTATFQVYDAAKAVNLSEVPGGGGATAAEIADAVWDETLTGATHNVPNSAGRRLRTLADTVVLAEGDVISADNNGTINGENGLGRVQFASDVGTVCVGQAVRVSGQVRYVELYDQPTQTATVDAPWCVVPTVGDEYTIFSQRSSLVMRINAAASGSIAFVIATVWRLIEDVGGPRFTAKAVELVTDGQEAIESLIQGSEVLTVASPNVRGNLVLTQGDTYDGLTGSNPKAQWTVTTDYTDGWAVTLTIRDKDDAVIYTRAGSVDSATTISVPINVPTVSPFEGCPGVWQGKYDVQLTKSSSIKTIAIGVVYVNEDQTR